MIDTDTTSKKSRAHILIPCAVAGAVMLAGFISCVVWPAPGGVAVAAPPTAAVKGGSGAGDPTEYPPAKGYVRHVDPKTLMTANPDLLARGKSLYQKHCFVCHGTTGKGDGPAAAGFTPKPRNFTQADGWKNGTSVTAIFKTLSEGLSGTAMPPYAQLSIKDRMALVHYVQSLGTFPNNAGDPAALAALASQISAQGEQVPNKIPVSMAIARLLAEHNAAPPLPLPAATRSDAGASLVRRIVSDPVRAGRTLALAPRWRKSADDLAQVVAPEVPANGFAAAAATLDENGWQVLYQELLRLESGAAKAVEPTR